jgi:bacterioferritin-associated ferredoxin
MPEVPLKSIADYNVSALSDAPICFCFNVTEQDVKLHFSANAGTYESLVEKTKVGTKCAACLLDLDLVLSRIHQERHETHVRAGDVVTHRSGFRHLIDFIDSGFFIYDSTVTTSVRLANFSQLFGAGASCVPFKYQLIVFSEAGKVIGKRFGHIVAESEVTIEIVPNDGSKRGWFIISLTARQEGFFGTMRPQVVLRGPNWSATYHTQPHMMASVGRARHEVLLQGDGRDLSAAVVIVNGSSVTASGALVLRNPQDGAIHEASFGLPGNGCNTFDLAHAFPDAPPDRPLFVQVRCNQPTRNHIINIHADSSLSVDHFPN